MKNYYSLLLIINQTFSIYLYTIKNSKILFSSKNKKALQQKAKGLGSV